MPIALVVVLQFAVASASNVNKPGWLWEQPVSSVIVCRWAAQFGASVGTRLDNCSASIATRPLSITVGVLFDWLPSEQSGFVAS